MGFMDGIRDVLGGFNAVKQIDSDGFDWREKRAAAQAARDQEVQQYDQQNQDYRTRAGAEAAIGGMPEGELGSMLPADLDPMRRKAEIARMVGQSAQSKSALEGQKAYTASLLQANKDAAAMDRTRQQGANAQEVVRLREKVHAGQQLSPREQAMLDSAEKMNADRIAAGDRRSASGGSSLSRRPTKVGGVDDQGRAGTWLIYPDDSREFMPAATTAGTRGKEEAKGAAMNAYRELMDVYDSMGGQPEGGMEARATGAYRTVSGKMGYDPATSTYQGGVRGFVPLMARALGHVGVLTELDVERTETLFPKAGDTDAEKMRKKRLLEDIMVGARPLPFKFEHDTRDEVGAAPPVGRPPAAPPQPPGAGGVVEIGSREEMAALPPGARFRYNGKVYTKKR